MRAAPTPSRLWDSASPEQRRAMMGILATCSTGLIREGWAALHRAGLDVAVDLDLPSLVANAEVALRHRAMVGRIPRFDPAVYAEMVAPMRTVLGELHPDDARDLAAVDLWAVQDRWTGEPSPDATDSQRARADRARMLLQSTAAESLG